MKTYDLAISVWQTSLEKIRWLALLLLPTILVACGDPAADGPKIQIKNVVAMRDEIPVVSGDIEVDLRGDRHGAVILEIVPDGYYQDWEGAPWGEQRGDIYDGLTVRTDHWSASKNGKYWIRAGDFSGRRGFGLLTSLVEIPIDKRGGFMFLTESTPKGRMIRNSYYMGEFKPFLWEPLQEESATKGVTTDETTTQESLKKLAFEPPDDIPPVSEARLRGLQSSMRSGAMALAARSGLANPSAYKQGDLEAWESKDRRIVVMLRSAEEPNPISEDSVFRQSLERIGWGVRTGVLNSSSSVKRNQVVANHPAVLSSLDIAPEGSYVRAYDVFLEEKSRSRHSFWVMYDDIEPDEALFDNLLNAVRVAK